MRVHGSLRRASDTTCSRMHLPYRVGGVAPAVDGSRVERASKPDGGDGTILERHGVTKRRRVQ